MLSNNDYTDVVIIGAGISGLSAAKALKKRGIQFKLLEASHRIGGRAYSEQLSSQNWFDLGCSYLHNGAINPFVAIARELGFPIDVKNGNLFDSQKTHYYSNGKKIDLGLPDPFDKYHDHLLRKIKNSKTDKSLAELMDFNDPFFPISCHLYASLNAADPDLVSSKDYEASLYKGPDYPIPRSFGNLINKWGRDISVSLNTKVNQLNWEDPMIKLKTSRGSLTTKKVILTVSTGILSAGDIKIIPEFPKETLAAVGNLPMGTLNKIGISFNKKLFSQRDHGWYVTWRNVDYPAEQDIGSFQVSATGPQNIVVFAGGRFGEWLEKCGSQTMLDYAISKIEDVFGKSVIKNIQNSITTAWVSEPLTKGSYSYATPGKSYSRSILSRIIDKKIHIAGEATQVNHYGTAHGAYFSGLRAANEILADLES